MTARILRRVIGMLVLMLVGWQVGSLIGSGSIQTRNEILGIAVGGVLGLTLTPFLIDAPYAGLRRLIARMPAEDLVYSLVGLVLGLVVAALLSYPLSLLPGLGHVLPVVAVLACGYLGIALLMMRRREISQALQARFGAHDAEQPAARFLVDTSAIIDGRIADIGQAGFLIGQLIVPRFVLAELQHIADSADPLRRNRGRRGLEILNRLRKDPDSNVEISDLDARELAEVDAKLIKLARQISCPVLTNDFNLNRVAELEGVRVMNINQLANALKPVVLPGEEMEVKIIQEGKELNQGVGYLDDGTMIVVENGRRFLHADVEIIVTRVLQTTAGRMIFAQPKSDARV